MALLDAQHMAFSVQHICRNGQIVRWASGQHVWRFREPKAKKHVRRIGQMGTETRLQSGQQGSSTGANGASHLFQQVQKSNGAVGGLVI